MKDIIYIIFCSGFLIAGETTAIYKVDGMMCGMNCPMKVKQSLNEVEGIKMCQVDFETKTATVTFDDAIIDRKKIADAIAKGTYYKVTDAEKKSWSFLDWLFRKS